MQNSIVAVGWTARSHFFLEQRSFFSEKHVPQFIVEVVILVAQNKIKIQMPAKSRNESSGCQKYTKYTASQSLSQYEAAAWCILME